MKNIALLVIGCGIGVLLAQTVPASPVYVTAAHIPATTMQGYTLLSYDKESDIAYYIDSSYVYKLPKKGDRVYLGNLKGQVTEILDDRTFAVKTYEQAYKGLSGARVGLTRDRPFAFVSYMNPAGEVVCISYE